MLKLIYEFYVQGNDALKADVEYLDLINLPVREKIGRAKYIPETEILELDKIEKEIKNAVKGLINGGGDNA